MSFLKKTIPVTRLQAEFEGPTGDLKVAELLRQVLEKYAFNPELSSGKINQGTVVFDDPTSSDFSDPDRWVGGPFAFFALRVDERKIPTALLKMEKAKAEKQFLAENPGLQRVPKQRKREIADAVEQHLLTQTPPTPTVTQVAWDLRTDEILVAATGRSRIDAVLAFMKRLEGVRVREVSPFERYRAKLAGTGLAETLEGANRAGTDATLDLIDSNLPLWQDFLAFLTWNTFNGKTTSTDRKGEEFVAYVADSFTLDSDDQQKVVISGPQERQAELKAALCDGKEISRLKLFIETGERQYVVTLPARTLSLHRVKMPPTPLDENIDHLSQVAALLDRLEDVSVVQGLVDDLVKTYLHWRSLDGAGTWADTTGFRTWIEEA